MRVGASDNVQGRYCNPCHRPGPIIERLPMRAVCPLWGGGADSPLSSRSPPPPPHRTDIDQQSAS